MIKPRYEKKFPRSPLQKYWLLNKVCNQIMYFNWKKIPVVAVSKRYYCDLLNLGLLDECCFDIHVTHYKFNPLNPVVYVPENKKYYSLP